MFKIFDNPDSDIMEKVAEAFVKSAKDISSDMDMSENRVVIYCYYTSSKLDLLSDQWNFMLELSHTFIGDELCLGQERSRCLKRIHYAIDNLDDACLFAETVYNTYQNQFDAQYLGYQISSCTHSSATSFGAWDEDYKIPTHGGTGFLCCGLPSKAATEIIQEQEVKRSLSACSHKKLFKS